MGEAPSICPEIRTACFATIVCQLVVLMKLTAVIELRYSGTAVMPWRIERQMALQAEQPVKYPKAADMTAACDGVGQPILSRLSTPPSDKGRFDRRKIAREVASPVKTRVMYQPSARRATTTGPMTRILSPAGCGLVAAP